jgi:hypothetical protein
MQTDVCQNPEKRTQSLTLAVLRDTLLPKLVTSDIAFQLLVKDNTQIIGASNE